MYLVQQDCHSLKGKDKGKVRASRAMVGIWAIRCTVSRVRNTAEVQEAWAVDTTNLADRAIKPGATARTVLGMDQDSMETAIVVDGGPTTGTKFPLMHSQMLLSDDVLFHLGMHSSLAKKWDDCWWSAYYGASD